MKSYDFEAVIFESEIYCVSCLPDGLDSENEGVMPIFCDSEWDYYPVCNHCNKTHDYVSLTEEGKRIEIESTFERLCNEYNTDVFLTPRLEEDYAEVETEDETYYFPIDDWRSIEGDNEYTFVKEHKGFIVRASANGYMDCTDWEPIESVSDLENWFEYHYELKESMED